MTHPTDQSSRELLPCPFCGNEHPSFERMGTNRQSCIVACGNCGARHESSDEYLNSGRSWNERAQPVAQEAIDWNEGRQTDQAVTAPFTEWLARPGQNCQGVGANEAWNAGVAWARSILAASHPSQGAPRVIGEIRIDAHNKPYARLLTAYDEHGNVWQDGAAIYAAPHPPVSAEAGKVEPVACWVDRTELENMKSYPDCEPTVSLKPVDERDVPLYLRPSQQALSDDTKRIDALEACTADNRWSVAHNTDSFTVYLGVGKHATRKTLREAIDSAILATAGGSEK